MGYLDLAREGNENVQAGHVVRTILGHSSVNARPLDIAPRFAREVDVSWRVEPEGKEVEYLLGLRITERHRRRCSHLHTDRVFGCCCRHSAFVPFLAFLGQYCMSSANRGRYRLEI